MARRRRSRFSRWRDTLLMPVFAILNFVGYLFYRLRTVRLWRMMQRGLHFLFLPFLYLFGLLQYLGWNLGQFLFDWGRTRVAVAFLYGLPALTVGIGMVFVLVTGLWQAKAELVTDYRRAAARALQDENLEQAELFARKLAYLDHQEPAVQFGIAMLALKEEQLGRAQQIMERIAPREEPGFVPAHLWLARWYLEKPVATDERRRELVLLHLENAVEAEPDHADANLILGQLRLAQQETQQADDHLRRVVRQRPELGSSIGRLWFQQGDGKRGREYIVRAEQHLEREVQRRPEDLVVRSQLADTYGLLGKYSEAERLLLDGQRLATTDELRDKLKLSLGGLYAAWADAVRRSKPDSMVASLKLLERAVQYAPSHPAVLLVIRECSTLEGEEETKFEALLEQMLTSGEAPALVHLIIGTKAVERDDFEKALLHLEQAYRLEPGSGVILGNLAWTLATSDPPEYERALELVNGAIDKLKTNAELYETRGLILVKLGRHREAIPDLERALTEIKGRPRLHELLAEAYESVGEGKLAQRHRELARGAPSKS